MKADLVFRTDVNVTR